MSIKFNEIDNAKALYTQGLAIQKVYWRDNLIWGSQEETTGLPYGNPLYIFSYDHSNFEFYEDGGIKKVTYEGVNEYHESQGASYKPRLTDNELFPNKKVITFDKTLGNYPYLKNSYATSSSKKVIVFLGRSLNPSAGVIFISGGHTNGDFGLYKTNNRLYGQTGPQTIEFIDDEWFIGVHYNHQGSTHFGKGSSSNLCEIAEAIVYGDDISDYTLAKAKSYLKEKWFGIIEEVDETLSKGSFTFDESRHLLFNGDSFDGTLWNNKAKYLDPYTSLKEPTANPYFQHNGIAPSIGELNGYKTLVFDGTQSFVGKNLPSLTSSSLLFTFVFKVDEGLEEGKKMPILGELSTYHYFIYDTTTKTIETKYTFATNSSVKIYHTNSEKGFEDWTVVAVYTSNDGTLIPKPTYIGLGTRTLTDGIQFKGEIAEISYTKLGMLNTYSSLTRNDVVENLAKKYGL